MITSGGRGIANAVLTMADQDGARKYAYTNPFGYYQFDNVPTGQSYLISARQKNYHFDTRIVTVGDEITGLDFMAID